jgi:hypothetical protein
VDDSGEVSRAEYYRLIRSQIEHEDNLVNQRVIWQIISQAFIFGAYATVLGVPKEPKNPFFEGQQQLLVWLLPVIGLSASLLTSAGIRSSVKTISHLAKLYAQYSESKVRDVSTKLYPDIEGPQHVRKLAQLAPTWIPVVFSFAWCVILLRLLASLL